MYRSPVPSWTPCWNGCCPRSGWSHPILVSTSPFHHLCDCPEVGLLVQWSSPGHHPPTMGRARDGSTVGTSAPSSHRSGQPCFHFSQQGGSPAACGSGSPREIRAERWVLQPHGLAEAPLDAEGSWQGQSHYAKGPSIYSPTGSRPWASTRSGRTGRALLPLAPAGRPQSPAAFPPQAVTQSTSSARVVCRQSASKVQAESK